MPLGNLLKFHDTYNTCKYDYIREVKFPLEKPMNLWT